MSLEEKIIAYKMLSLQIESLEMQKKTLAQEILTAMPSKKVDVGNYRASRYIRLSIRLPLEQARLLGATKMEEQIDKDKIKERHKMGEKIEGVQEIAYLVVTTTPPKD